MPRFGLVFSLSWAAIVGLGSVTACSTKSDDAKPGADGGAGDGASAAELPTRFGGARPVDLRVPEGYDPKKPAPLLLMLHGYGSGGALNDVYLKMTSIADAKGFLYVSPDGTVDSKDKHFWNATDLCCDRDNTGVDDVAYLASLIDEIKRVYAVDRKRIFVMGHSNGGYMANRLACDRSETFAAAVSLAGGNWSDAARCAPSVPIAYLQIHGTQDETVPFQEGSRALGIWAQKNGCEGALAETGATLRVNGDAKAPDTKVARHGTCKANGAAEIWPVEGAGHIFAFTPDAVAAVWQFMESHAKP